VKRIELAKDRDNWWAHVSTVVGLWVAENTGRFLVSRRTVRFSRKAYCKYLVSQLVS
jgi:hypothetical protein